MAGGNAGRGWRRARKNGARSALRELVNAYVRGKYAKGKPREQATRQPTAKQSANDSAANGIGDKEVSLPFWCSFWCSFIHEISLDAGDEQALQPGP